MKTYSRRTFIARSSTTFCVLSLAGCGGGSESSGGTPGMSSVPVLSDTPVSPPTPTPTPSPTPTPTDPTTTPVQSARHGVIVQAGDSIGVGYGAGGWAGFDHLGFGSGVTVFNVAITGRTMLTGLQDIDDLLRHYNPAYPSILLIEQGTNDLSGGSTAEDLYQWVAAPFTRRASGAGFYVVLNTILPREDIGWNSAKELQRQRYNALVRNNAAGADLVNDLASDSMIGDGNPNYLAYYPDGLHPGLTGQQRLALITAATIAPLLDKAPKPAT